MGNLKFSILIAVMVLIGLMAFSYLHEAEWTPGNKRKAAYEAIAEDCMVIGNAVDYSRSRMHHMRTIYKCPDGMIKIR